MTDPNLINYFDAMVKNYEKSDCSSFWNSALLNVLRPIIPSKILDVGCGIGTQVRVLGSLGCDVVGVDLSLKSLEMALKRCEYLGNGVRFIHGDIMEQNFEDEEGKFDCVLFHNSLENFEDPVEPMNHAAQYLNECGRVYITIFNAEGWMREVQEYIRGCLMGELASVDELHTFNAIDRAVKTAFPDFELLERWEFGEVYDVTGNKHHVSYEPFMPNNGLRGRQLALLYGLRGGVA